MSERINDGQLDHTNKQIETHRKTIDFLSQLCGKRFDLLKEVASCAVSHSSINKYHEVQIPISLWQAIRDETDEHEVGT